MARIIYVEDDELMGDIVKEALSAAGHIVGVITHGTLAFETITFKRPDLVILDSSVPGMKGTAILRRMRALPELYLTPIVMLTARADAEDVDAAIAAGANEYLVKPIAAEEIVARVNAVLSSNDWRRRRAEGAEKADAPEAAADRD
jgi:DNA-binding response OmpR family regulator